MTTPIDTSRSLRVMGDLLFRHWGTKTIALILAAMLFIVTRDEVTRGFEIPIRVVADPERVLLTDVPETMQVQVRGPWTRVNRLQDYDFGAAVLDLRSASVGPLQIDQASIVMPPGVVLSTIQYDHVDLRFEPIITREVSIVPIVVGSPAADYPLVRVEAEPARWPIRGGRSEVEGVEQLSTEPLDISGANNTLTRTLALIPPNGHVTLERAEGEPPRVEVRAVIEPVVETRQWVIPVDVPEQLDHSGVIPSTYTVEVTGPRPKFRRLGELQLEVAVEAEVVPLREKTTTGGRMVEVRFGWGDDVPEDVRQALRLHHRVVRVSLPPDSPRSPGRGDRNTGQPP